MKLSKILAYLSFFLIIVFLLVAPAFLPTLSIFGYYGVRANKEAPQFRMKNTKGQIVSLKDLKDNYLYIYFGFTKCSTLCPAHMSGLNTLAKKIDRDDVKFLYITIDPQNDSPEVLDAYLQQFGNRFIALYDSKEVVKEVSRSYRIYYKDIKINSQIDHSDMIYFLDKNSKIRLTYTTQHSDANKMASDFNRFVKDNERKNSNE